MEVQSINHLSDTDITSESNFSDFSRSLNFNSNYKKKVSSELPTRRSIGSRASRRHRNNACLFSLSILLEADLDETYFLPEEITGSTYLSKILSDESLLKVWQEFVSKSEIEQNEILSKNCPKFIPSSMNKRKKFKKAEQVNSDSEFLEDFVIVPKQKTETIEDRLSFKSLEKVYLNPLEHYRKFYRTRKRKCHERSLSPYDIYLCENVERELRSVFSQRNSNLNWFPKKSLLGLKDGDPIWLDNFQRKLVHQIAQHLDLNSFSTYNDTILDRQINVTSLATINEVSFPENFFLNSS